MPNLMWKPYVLSKARRMVQVVLGATSCPTSRKATAGFLLQCNLWKRLSPTVDKEPRAKTFTLFVSSPHCLDVMMNNMKGLNNRKEREVSVTQRVPSTGQLPPCALRDPVGARRTRAPVSYCTDGHCSFIRCHAGAPCFGKNYISKWLHDGMPTCRLGRGFFLLMVKAEHGTSVDMGSVSTCSRSLNYDFA